MSRSKKQDAPVVRCKVTVRHDFTNEEWKSKTNELTRKMKSVTLKEEAIKAQAAAAKSDLKTLKSEVSDLANQVDDGYEMRSVEATVEFSRKKGSKKYYHFAPGNRELHGKLIREEAMSEEDFQALPLEDQAPATAQPAPEHNDEPARVKSADEPQEESEVV